MRQNGTFNFGANLEVKKDAPLDARTLVSQYADLVKPETWADSDGNTWLYICALVVCQDRPGKLYQLINKDFTKESSWKEIGADVDLGDYLKKEDAATELNISRDAENVTLALSTDSEDVGGEHNIPAATTTHAGVMSAEDKGYLNRAQVEEGSYLSVDEVDGVLFQVKDGEDSSYDVAINKNQMSVDSNSFSFPTKSGTLALMGDITDAVKDIPSEAMTEDDINEACK